MSEERQQHQQDPRGKLLKLRQAAARWNVDYDTALRWVKNGAVPSVTVGPNNLLRIYEVDVEAAIKSNN